MMMMLMMTLMTTERGDDNNHGDKVTLTMMVSGSLCLGVVTLNPLWVCSGAFEGPGLC